MCVYFLFTILYYVKECKFGEVCVVYVRTLYEVKIRSWTPMCCGTATTVIIRRRERESVCVRLSEQYVKKKDLLPTSYHVFTDNKNKNPIYLVYIHNNNIPPTTYLFRWIPIYTTSAVVAQPSSGLDRFRSYNETTTTMYYVHNSVLYNII